MNKAETYKPTNYSDTKCFVVSLKIAGKGIYKIDRRLPKEIKTVKGLFISCSADHKDLAVGYINLFLNEGIFKSYQSSVLATMQLSDHSSLFPLKEEIKPNTALTGVFYHLKGAEAYPFTLKIYLHYTKE